MIRRSEHLQTVAESFGVNENFDTDVLTHTTRYYQTLSYLNIDCTLISFSSTFFVVVAVYELFWA